MAAVAAVAALVAAAARVRAAVVFPLPPFCEKNPVFIGAFSHSAALFTIRRQQPVAALSEKPQSTVCTPIRCAADGEAGFGMQPVDIALPKGSKCLSHRRIERGPPVFRQVGEDIGIVALQAR